MPQSHRFGIGQKFIEFCSSLGTVNFSDYSDCYFGRPIDGQDQDI